MRHFYWVGLWVTWLLLSCSSDHTQQKPTPMATPHVTRTTGSAVALTRDEQIAVVTNRTQGSVSVFAISVAEGLTQAAIVTSFDTGADSEPWAAVVGADDDTAYVLFRNSQLVRRIKSLHGTPVLEKAGVSVGSEPTAIALTPSGQKLLVANWGEGTVSVITTRDFVAQVKIDLNRALVSTGALGQVDSRLALAHPRALAVTDNGDDSDLDETLYATEFFSQPVLPYQGDPDRDRQGFVYPVSLKTGQPGSAIAISSVPATGFTDGNGAMTGCFPNQLYAAAVDSGRLYVTSMCTSPAGPLGAKAADGTVTDKNFKTLLHPAVFVIDTATNTQLAQQNPLLTSTLDAYYQSGEDATNERMPLIPNDIVFASSEASGSHAYISALGADALFRLDYDATGVLQGIGDANARYIDVQSNHGLPVGVAVSKISKPAFALAVTDAKLRLSIVDLATQTVNSIDSYGDEASAATFRESDEAQGRGFFGTGLDVWSFKGQAWSSCESCHPGGLSDGVTWSFARGPRRTISTAGTYEKSADFAARTRRMLLWGANIDELHDVEAIVRGVSGGVGAALWTYNIAGATNDCRMTYDGSTPVASGLGPCFASKPTTDLENGLNGSLGTLDSGGSCLFAEKTCDKMALPDWTLIDRFIRSERAPRSPSVCTGDLTEDCLSPDDISAGRALFEQGQCAGCHGGPGWTISKLFYTPGAAQNGELPSVKPSALPAQLGALRTATYSVPEQLLALNPAAQLGTGLEPGGGPPSATFRSMPVPAAPDGALLDFLYTPANQTDDQIRCSLRAVGTFPGQTKPNVNGVTAPDAPGVVEVRQDMKTLAQGATGFNVPSLFGLALGAPYFHAGNAPTLEALFDPQTFAKHHQALAPGFLEAPAASRGDQVRQLVSFLLSIDEGTDLEPVPSKDVNGDPIAYDFCQP